MNNSYLFELLIAQQLERGVTYEQMSIQECPPAQIRNLVVDGKIVVTELLPRRLWATLQTEYQCANGVFEL